jgi:4'-phosphopantetheinyl transferase EntD
LIILRTETADAEQFALWHNEAQKRMPDVHANRKIEWALARMALAQTLALHGMKLTPSQCLFKGHHELTHLPQWRFSLSHTKDVAAAWLMPAARVRGLGLDIEFKDRKVPPQVKARLAHKNDTVLPALQLWALKEAAFKALPTLAQNDVWLNRLIIAEKSFELENSPFVGEWELTEESDLFIARAWLSH